MPEPDIPGNRPIEVATGCDPLLIGAHGKEGDEATDPELAEWIIELSGALTPEQLAERIRLLLIAATSR